MDSFLSLIVSSFMYNLVSLHNFTFRYVVVESFFFLLDDQLVCFLEGYNYFSNAQFSLGDYMLVFFSCVCNF